MTEEQDDGGGEQVAIKGDQIKSQMGMYIAYR
jgi:hypothetical protein